jgi:rhodanese-related sulfurtransferase
VTPAGGSTATGAVAEHRVKKLLLEGLAVGVVGVGLGFAANALSPRGIKLSRNYFPAGTTQQVSPATNSGGSTNTSSAVDPVVLRLQSKGLQIIEGSNVEALFQDPRYQQELIVFIDARDDQHYQAGHIPGAYQLDYYRPESYLPAVLSACQAAQQIIVYCKGGECEDSELAAILLRDSLGVSKERLFIYHQGFTDWEAKRRPIEVGSRKSGQIQNQK